MIGQERIIYVGYDCPKRYVLRLFLKLSLDFLAQILGSMLFQICGPTELKDPSFTRLVLHLADCRLPLVEDLREQIMGDNWKKIYKILWGCPHLASVYQAGYLCRR